MINEPIEPGVTTAIRELIWREMERFGLRDVRVSPSEDHDGDPILLVEVDYDPVGEPVDPKIVANLVSKLRNRVWALNEHRFPHIRHHFSEQQKIAGYS